MDNLISHPHALAVELAYRRALLGAADPSRPWARRRRPVVRWPYGRHGSGGA